MNALFTLLYLLPKLRGRFTSLFRLEILSLMLGISFVSSAQNVKWNKTIGGNYGDTFVAAQQTSDGGYILGGNSASGKSGDKTGARKGMADYWIVKLNPDGSKAWDKTIGGNDYDALTSLQQTKDGGYILGGSSNSGISGDKTEAPKGFWVVRLNADGTKAWDKTIADSRNPANYSYLRTLQLTPDGGYLLGGTSNAGVGDYKSEPSKGSNDYWVVKLNADGSKAWDKTIGTEGSESLLSVEQTSDNGYILGGYSARVTTRGYWLVKLNVNRSIVWDKFIPEGYPVYEYPGAENSTSEINIVKPTPDGGYILGGYADSKTNVYKSEAGNGSTDFWLIKLKADGQQEWNKVIGGTDRETLNSLQPTSDGGYLLGGNSRSNSSGDKTQNSQGSFDYWVVKLNADRTKAWDLTLGGNKEDNLGNVFQTKDKGYFLGGYSRSDVSETKTEASRGDYDYWVVKLDNSERQKQTVTFSPIPDVNYATQKTVTLKATASSGLPASFALISGPATVKGNTLTLTGGSGTVTVSASQAGNQKYFPAIDDTARFVVQVPPVTRLWDKSYGGVATEYYDQYTKYYGTSTLSTMVATSDGGYLLGGTSDSNRGNDKTQPTRGKSDYWIVKVDASGKKLWDKVYGGKDSDGLNRLITTTDGGYLLGGTSRSGKNGDKSQDSKGGKDYWLLKIDATGNKLWDKTYGGGNEDEFTNLISTPDGGYLLGGTSYSQNSGDKSEVSRGNADYWVVKIDAQGTKQWDKTLGGKFGEYLSSLATTPDSGYLIGGSTLSPTSGDITAPIKGGGDIWLVKIDANGQKSWDKTFGGGGGDGLGNIVPTSDGNYLLGGDSYSVSNGDKTAPNKGHTDYWLIKINPNGNKIWDKTFGGNCYDYFSNLVATPDGGFFLGGSSSSEISGDKSETNRGSYYKECESGLGQTDYWIIKLDANANKVWDRTFGTVAPQSSYTDRLTTLLATTNGEYLIGGDTNIGKSGDKSQPIKGVRDIWVIKIKEETTQETSAWDMRYGGASEDKLTSIIETSDAGYLSGGYSYSGSSGDKTQDTQGKIDYWIVKSDKNGKKLWDKRYGGTFDDFLNRVIQTKDGGYLLAGSSRSDENGDKSEISRDTGYDYFKKRDFWLVKVDSLGNKQWDKTLGGSGLDELEKVIQLSSGEYVLAGHSNSPASGDKSQGTQGGYDYWLVKVSATGTKIWDKRYGGTLDEVLGSFTQTQDGGFLLGGTSYSGRNRDKSQTSRGKSDYWIVRTDKDGNKLWDKTFGGNGEDNLASLGRSNGGSFFLAGTSNSPKSGDKSQAGYLDEVGYATADYWLIKIDAQGNKVWDKTLGGTSSDALLTSTYTRDGGYVLAGGSYSNKSGDKTQDRVGESDFWIIKLDANGSKQWDKTIGGTESDALRTVLQTNDGGLLLGGSSNSPVSGDKTQPSRGFSDYWLVKLAPETSSIAATREATSLEQLVALTTALTAYPNPFHGQITVQFSLPETQTATVKIYDNQGMEVSTLFQGEAKAKQIYQVEWQAGTKPAGLYFLQLQTPTKREQQKLLLTK
ncbi:hypothetical protein AHMF7605_10680 [Adhaeribacter arboris]|uniref:Secretion system C-terminal sorting domain-containing protein n=1 Tax=Adhaeribacter arboris TaxID=2072846 RepID=A0A2T2YEL4_9BACT|nr:T9SS type A sorting domain-containing protein [Adhaeribacter arboris]PSR53949.1 hypothetical protein AHMF7605_10680 [Adhaeribacter arboris]